MAQANEYDYLTRAELIDQLNFNQSELNKLMIKAEPTEENDKQATGNVKTLLETKIGKIKDTLKSNMVVALQTSAAGVPVAQTYDQDMVKTMKETASIQNLLDVVRNVPKLNVGDSIERFVSELDQIYKVEVEPQVGDIDRTSVV